MKNQESQGSVDEKLQSFQFKIDYFEKLLSKKVHYAILNLNICIY